MLPDVDSERLRLRPLVLCDAPALLEITDEADVIASIPFFESAPTLADIEALIRRGMSGNEQFIGATRKTDQALVAVVGCHLRNTGDIEIGYWAGAAYRRQGYTREAAASVVTLLHATIPTRRIIAECRPENEVSWHMLQSIGFRHDGQAGTRPGRKHLIWHEGGSNS